MMAVRNIFFCLKNKLTVVRLLFWVHFILLSNYGHVDHNELIIMRDARGCVVKEYNNQQQKKTLYKKIQNNGKMVYFDLLCSDDDENSSALALCSKQARDFFNKQRGLYYATTTVSVFHSWKINTYRIKVVIENVLVLVIMFYL